VWIERFWKKREAATPRSLSQLAGESPELAGILARYGYAPGNQEKVRRLLESLKSLIRTEVTDFTAFRQALRGAYLREGDIPRYEVRNRELLIAAVEAGDNDQAVLAVLNRNPIYEHVPFVERVPVMRRGEIAWLTPVDHACILKRPADPARFASLLSELDTCFCEPHPARSDALRAQVVEAISRLRRELKRERAYFPTGIQFLEARIAAYESESLDPSARAAVEALTRIFECAERVRSESSAPKPMTGRDGKAALKAIREAVSHYLDNSALWNSWTTNYLAEILLSPAFLESSVRRPRKARETAALVRAEIASGFYDTEEVNRRIRRLEESGLYVSSVVYGLLAMGKGVKPRQRRT
jgi:hypothetical protein